MTTSPGIPPPPLRLGNTSAAGGGLRPGQQPTVETASPLAGLDLDCTRLALKLHPQRSVHRLRDFGNRGGRLVADLVGVDDRGPSWPPTMAVTEGVPAIAPTVRSPMTALVQAHTDLATRTSGARQ